MRYEREREFDSLIYRIAVPHVPPWFVKATIGQESSFRPGAVGDGGQSIGLMQINKRTARAYGASDSFEYLSIPGNNIRLGVRLIRELIARFPNASWDEIYSAYNAGEVEYRGGILQNQSNVDLWKRVADYFYPEWRASKPGRIPGASGQFNPAPGPDPPDTIPDPISPPMETPTADPPAAPPRHCCLSESLRSDISSLLRSIADRIERG